jgi:NADPH-dependent 2,4-dienoyl-CoA reductase/sulfur reductase-like enzyme/rhodanese-related sulfurtransferase
MDPHADITIIQKENDLSMASCGYPYYVGGVFDERNKLICTPTGVVRDPNFFMNAKAIKALNNTEATDINIGEKKVAYRNLRNGEEGEVEYDRLIIATGAKPRMPPVKGIDLDGISTLQSLGDADYLRKVRDEGKITKAVVVGGGLIGLETCEALQLAGIEITVIEMMPQILMFMDWQLAKILENNIRNWAANVITDNAVVEFLGEEGKLTGVKLANGTELPCELAVISIGVAPNVELARKARVKIGEKGGIEVDEFMQTSIPDVYAIGDCIEIPNLITNKKVLAPYGDLANLEGRVAGENAATENIARFPGCIQTGICKVFNYNAGTTGIFEKEAVEAGFDPISVITASPDKPGFMGGLLLINKMVADRKTGRILGFQCVGPGDVSKQVAQAAVAIKGKMTVDEMVNADLPYAPPFTLAVDNLIAVSHVLQNKMRGLFTGVSAAEVKKEMESDDKPFLIDMRGPGEYEAMRLGIGEVLIPLGALRKRVNELPEDKNKEIIVYCKISLRGYEAARYIQSLGYTDVKVMEGGIMAWPFPREK